MNKLFFDKIIEVYAYSIMIASTIIMSEIFITTYFTTDKVMLFRIDINMFGEADFEFIMIILGIIAIIYTAINKVKK